MHELLSIYSSRHPEELWKLMRKNTPAANVVWDENSGASPVAAPTAPSAAKGDPAEAERSLARRPAVVPPMVKKRVQFDFSEEAYQRLERLRARTQKQSQAEVVRTSLRVYEWLLEQIEKGYTVQLAKDDFVKEVELLL
jgi:hypothetical protein